MTAPDAPFTGDLRFDGLAVLLVEDNVRLRGMIARTLESLGCSVIAAGEAGEAMRLLQAGSVVQLMLSDIRMPGPTDGVALAEWVSTHHPDIAILLVTGFTHTANIRFAVLSKPFGLDQLIEAMGRALGPASSGNATPSSS